MVIGFIVYLQNVTTSNCSAIANSHTLQFATALIKSSHSAVFTGCDLVTASNAVTSSASAFMSLQAGVCLTTNSALLRDDFQQLGLVRLPHLH
jgi:hypothetical protein